MPRHIPDTQCTCILKQPLLLPSGHGLCSSWCLPAFWHSSAGTGTSGAHGPYLTLDLKKLYRSLISTTPWGGRWAINWEKENLTFNLQRMTSKKNVKAPRDWVFWKYNQAVSLSVAKVDQCLYFLKSPRYVWVMGICCNFTFLLQRHVWSYFLSCWTQNRI